MFTLGRMHYERILYVEGAVSALAKVDDITAQVSLSIRLSPQQVCHNLRHGAMFTHFSHAFLPMCVRPDITSHKKYRHVFLDTTSYKMYIGYLTSFLSILTGQATCLVRCYSIMVAILVKVQAN